MKTSAAHPLIERAAAELHLKIARSPFHASEGIELRKQEVDDDVIDCVGYIYGPEETVIYRRKESRRDLFVRDRLWFLWGWLIRPRIHDNQYRELRIVPSSEFSDKLFVDIAKQEFDGEQVAE